MIMQTKLAPHILVGNSFPLSLVRRSVHIIPRTQAEWNHALGEAVGVKSYWGHANTLAAANSWTGTDLTPATQRPALSLDSNGHPSLESESFTRCWVLSPDYVTGFRPKEGEIVPAEAILGWQALEMIWE